MTPQEFIDTLEPPETLRHAAIVAKVPHYLVAQWMSAVRLHCGIRFDRYDFRINPMRLHGFIDGQREPRLSITFHDFMAGQTPDSAPAASAILIKEISL